MGYVCYALDADGDDRLLGRIGSVMWQRSLEPHRTAPTSWRRICLSDNSSLVRGWKDNWKCPSVWQHWRESLLELRISCQSEESTESSSVVYSYNMWWLDRRSEMVHERDICGQTTGLDWRSTAMDADRNWSENKSRRKSIRCSTLSVLLLVISN
jgi:hypothetical protein